MEEIKKCPYCGEEVLSVAKKCKHCAEWLGNSHSGNMKSQSSIKKIANYFRELSIIIVGVSITVGVGLWMNNKSNEKDLKQYLLAVKMELGENAATFDDYAKWLQKSAKYAEYLELNHKKPLNKDSLDYYMISDNDGCGYGYTLSPSASFMTNAFEMLKFSGAMRQIKDKELLSYIWWAYTKIEETKQNLDRAFEQKELEVNKEVLIMMEGERSARPVEAFYSCGMPHEMVRWCEQTSEALKRTLSKLEEAKIEKK